MGSAASQAIERRKKAADANSGVLDLAALDLPLGDDEVAANTTPPSSLTKTRSWRNSSRPISELPTEADFCVNFADAFSPEWVILLKDVKKLSLHANKYALLLGKNRNTNRKSKVEADS